MNDRKCLQCFEQLCGRADQKFCSDSCRAAYNNAQSCEKSVVVTQINHILKKNHTILDVFITKGKKVVDKSDLLNEGYRFEYHTGIIRKKNNEVDFNCYDISFREKENHKLVLERRGMTM